MPYKENNKWIAQVVISGKRYKHRCSTKKEATEWEISQQKKVRIEIKDTTLDKLQTTYLEHCRKEFVDATCYEKRLAFDRLFLSLPKETKLSSITPIQLLRHLQQVASSRSGYTANKDRKNLSTAWKWANEYLGIDFDNPFVKIKKQGEIRHNRKVPSMPEFMAVYNAVPTAQDRRMLLCYLYSGARRDELFRFTWNDVDFSAGKICLRWRKNLLGTWQSAWLCLADEAMDALKEQFVDTGKLEWVFVDPDTKERYRYRIHWLRNACKRAKVERFGVHGVRHLCASILAGKGVPLVDIQYHLRHTHLSTTERYIHRLKENRSTMEALSGLHLAFLDENPQKITKI